MSENNEDHTTAISQLIESGEEEEIRTILGNREMLRVAGYLRGGVKVCKKECTPQEKAKFKELEAQGLPYDKIDEALGGKSKSNDSKLYPLNVDYFVIRDCDWKRPSDAAYIREHFKDPDGFVRRIPCYFLSSDIDKSMPHGWKAFNAANNCTAFSFYEGNQLMLKYVPKSIRQPKKEDWKVAEFDPEKVPADAPVVKFSGFFRFNIPGLLGLGEVICKSSWYGLSYASATFNKLKDPRVLGRYDGLFEGDSFLEIIKSPEQTKHEGKRQTQQIITVELAIDPLRLVRHAEKTLERGARAISLFNAVSSPVAHAANPAASTPPTPPVPPQPETKPEEKKEAAGDVDDVVEKARSAIQSLGTKSDLSEAEIDAFYELSGGKKKADTKDAAELRFLYGALRKALAEQDGPAKVKEAVKKYLPEPAGEQQFDPEIEAMINEIMMLAENADLDTAHIRAHLCAITGGVAVEDQGLIELQQSYREIEARCQRDIEAFKAEIAQDFDMSAK